MLASGTRKWHGSVVNASIARFNGAIALNMNLLYLATACETFTFCCGVVSAAGFINALVQCYQDGWWGNQFASLWVCLFGAVIAAQTYNVYKSPAISANTVFRRWLWFTYAAYMAAIAVILLVCYGMVPSPSSISVSGRTGWWALTWYPPLGFMVTYVWVHRQHKMPGTVQRLQHNTATSGGNMQCSHVAEQSGPFVLAPVPEAVDEELHVDSSCVTLADKIVHQELNFMQQPMAGTKRQDELQDTQQQTHQQTRSSNESSRCWRSAVHVVLWALGWSSIPWSVGLCFFLALQAAWQAADFIKYPATSYGQLLPVAIDNTEYTAKLFIRCVGPDTPELSTFLLEAGEGAPAATLFELQDQLSLAGRRSCSYDRLGLGWSDEFIQSSNLKRVPMILKNLLATADPSGSRYILAGHGQGGQFALQFASMYPEKVAGLALLDSFSATAEYLDRDLIYNHTDIWGNVLYRFRDNYPQQQLTFLSLLRAIAPFAWTRWIPGDHKQFTGYWYRDVVRALYSSNKASQGRWGEWSTLFGSLPDSLDEQLTLLSQRDGFWYGTGWKDFSPCPVLIMPAATSLESAGCDITQTDCQQLVLSTEMPFLYMAFKPKQVLVYASTLSDNATVHVMPGDHTYPWADASGAAAMLLAKFAGV